MKKDLRKTLRLGREIVRDLSSTELAAIVGGDGTEITVGKASCVPATSVRVSCRACQ